MSDALVTGILSPKVKEHAFTVYDKYWPQAKRDALSDHITSMYSGWGCEVESISITELFKPQRKDVIVTFRAAGVADANLSVDIEATALPDHDVLCITARPYE